ncbi:pseudouridine synthase [Mycoplasmopsis mucosicanis]|nr:pseudouridine synthase [Mycoplasmopsis mucosicanis]
MSEHIRLDKLLANELEISRSQANKLIASEQINVNNQIVKKNVNIDLLNDFVDYNGQKIEYVQYKYYLVNKPKNCVCANKDNINKTIFEAVELNEQIYRCAGRLDKDTTGMILITNDGKLINYLTSPKKKIVKKYLVQVDKDFDDKIKNFNQPIPIENFVVNDYKFEFISKNECYLSIYEGKFHQVKQMLKYFDFDVKSLKRVSIGNFEIPKNLAEGQKIKIEKKLINFFFNF